MEHGCFVTATGTGIGKTVVSALLTRAALATGRRTVYCKPVETGAADGMAPGADVRAVLAENPALGALDPALLQCALFRLPASPHLAAAVERRTIDPAVLEAHLARLCEQFDIVIAEGAGGLLVPLAGDYLVADLVKASSLPALVVAPAGLGTINATLLTLEALRARGIAIAGVVLNRWPEAPGPVELDNRATIERLGGTRVLGLVPELVPGDPLSHIFEPAIFS